MPSEEETIIVGGGKKQQNRTAEPLAVKTTVAPQGLESLKTMLKKYTTYVWLAVAGLPQLYTSILLLGPIPERFQTALWSLAVAGLFLSWIRQRKLDC